MKNSLSRTAQEAVKNWWISIIIGILSLILGFIFIYQPFDALATLVIFFVIGFFIAGIFEIVFALSNKDYITGWGWSLVIGIIDILLGILLVSTPLLTPIAMIYFFGFWVMFQSIWGIGISVDLQQIGAKGWVWLLILSILGVLCSFVFLLSPSIAPGFIISMAAVAFFVYGIFRIYLGIRLKSLKNEM